MNGHFEQGNFKASESIHLSTTIALKEGGVLVPAILDAQNLTLLELQRSFEDLVVRTRRSELKNRELTEGTFTITNIGDLGVDEVFGVIFPPQVAMLGLGQIRKAPMVVGEKVTSSWVVDVTLSADHRVSDGIEGAHFLRKIEEHLLQPELLGEV
jgi:pyruvate dehydrogenase E2 component (dihydrolipoamide acetyltransferase)